MRNLVGALVLALVGLAPLSVEAQRTAVYDTPPNFAARPKAAQIVSVYPAKARATGVDGDAMIQCIVTVNGGLRRCVVISEKPENLDFGRAALALAPQFLMKPATKGGRAVESAVNIPIHFPGVGTRTGSFIPGDRNPSQRLAANVPWREAPTYDDLIAVYPEGAKNRNLGGRAILNCVFGEAGRLERCSVLNESPSGQKFGEAARRLMSRFLGPERYADGVPTNGSSTQIGFTFNPKMLERRDAIVSPKWISTPSVEQMNAVFPAKAKVESITSSRVALDCKVAPAGTLTGCTVASETPGGYGFGQAALQLVPLFRMPVWSEEGAPVVGASLRLPLRYELGPQAPASK
jgi:TonB family protein